MARRFSFGRLLSRFYRRLWGLPEKSIENTGRRGFIVIQIDGLSLFILKLALRQRFMPFVKKLIRRKKYGCRLEPLAAGLPATTPAFQLTMLYGNDRIAPGFRWFERDTRRFMVMKGIEDVAEVEKRAESEGRGVLEGGAAYSTLFSGGAAETNFTASRLSMKPQKFALGLLELAALTVLNLGSFFRVIGLSMLEIATEIYDEIKVRMRGGLRRNAFAFTLVRVVSNVILRELSTAMAVSDIYRGAPSIYINYFGYDELGHHRGPHSLMARIALRGIDAQIKKLWKAAKSAYPGRYDVIIISDHGQTPSVPFEKMYPGPFSDYLSGAILKQRVSELRDTGFGERALRAASFINWANAMSQVVPGFVKRLLDWLSRRLTRDLSVLVTPREAMELGSIYLLPTSDLAHLYFDDRGARHSVEDLERDHPGVIASVVGHPGILLAAGISRAGVSVFTKKGVSLLDPESAVLLSGPDPFKGFDAPPGIARSLVRLVSMKHAGDLVIFTSRAVQRVVNFQEELGGHGGLYPEEQNAFAIVPPGVQLPPPAGGGPPGAKEMYALLSRYSKGS